jgi:hypothetical protein
MVGLITLLQGGFSGKLCGTSQLKAPKSWLSVIYRRLLHLNCPYYVGRGGFSEKN